MALSGSDLADFIENREAYLKMKDRLLKQYPGQFIAIYNGKLVAVNPDKAALIKETREKIGNVRAYIQEVRKEEFRIKMPTSRRLASLIPD